MRSAIMEVMGLRGLVIAAVLAVPVGAAAEPVVVAGGALRVEVARGVDDAERLPGWIAERNPELAGELAGAPGRERWVSVEIDGRYLDFRYRVVGMRDGVPVGDAEAWVPCECSNDDLLARVDGAIAAAVERLQTEPVAEPSGPPVGPTPVVPAASDVRYRRMTSLGTAGIATGAVGLAGVVVGVAFVGVGERVSADHQYLQRDHGPPGVALLASGGVVLAVGVGLLVADLVQCSRKRERCVVGGGGRASVGSGVVWRFGWRRAT